MKFNPTQGKGPSNFSQPKTLRSRKPTLRGGSSTFGEGQVRFESHESDFPRERFRPNGIKVKVKHSKS